MNRRSTVLPVLLFALMNIYPAAYSERYDLEKAALYDQPAPGEYRWQVFVITGDTAPAPGAPGHDENYPLQGAGGWNVYFVEHIYFAVTSTDVDPTTNNNADVLYTHYDFDAAQVFEKMRLWMITGKILVVIIR